MSGQGASTKVKGSVITIKAKTKCTLPAVSDLNKTSYLQGRHHFDLSTKDKIALVESEIKFVKGWGGQVVKLGSAVPAGTGGIITALAFSGYRWMKKIKNKAHYWDGSAWKAMPKKFKLKDDNNFCVGFYKDGSSFKCQYNGIWPESFQDWNIDSNKNKKKIEQWEKTIDSTWSNKFRLKRKECQSPNKKCCSYQLNTAVTIIKQTSFSTGMLIISDGNIRSNDSLFFIGEPRIKMAAHEFGHHLGNPDEYKGATSVDTTMQGDGAVKGIDNNSIMGANLSIVKKRHLLVVCKHLGSMEKNQKGTAYNYVPV